jgi:SagB-type dehydrogenase family enzyme
VHAEGDAQPGLYAAALRQEAVREAPVVIVIAAVYARTAQKYGEARGPRYVHLEAGHAAQNVLLQAVALDLGAVPIGAFGDDAVQRVLALPADHAPLYLIPVGHTL